MLKTLHITMFFLFSIHVLEPADGAGEGEEPPVVVLEEAAAVVGVIPLAVSRQFVTTL
jgi:hypothetical protein